jgi:hypothetical protein
MEMLTLIIALSAILWYLIDRFKPIWEPFSFGKYVTMVVACAGGAAFAFGFNLDILVACGLITEVSVIGLVITTLCFMAGSSAVSEIIRKIKGE